MARASDFILDPRIPARSNVLNRRVDPGTVGAQYVPTVGGRGGIRANSFGRDPQAGQSPLDVITSSTYDQQQAPPQVSSTFLQPGTLVNDGIAGDGNAGADAAGTPGEGGGAGNTANGDPASPNDPNGINNAPPGLVTVMSMLPGPIGFPATVARTLQMIYNNVVDNPENADPNGLDPAETATVQSETQQNNPGSVQSPGDEGAEDTAAASAAQAASATGPSEAAGTSDSADGDGGAASSGDAAAAAAAADAANASDATGGAAWEEGGVIPGMEDGVSSPVPNQTMHEGEGVITAQAMQLIGPDTIERVNQLPMMDPASQAQAIEEIVESLLAIANGGGGPMPGPSGAMPPSDQFGYPEVSGNMDMAMMGMDPMEGMEGMMGMEGMGDDMAGRSMPAMPSDWMEQSGYGASRTMPRMPPRSIPGVTRQMPTSPMAGIRARV